MNFLVVWLKQIRVNFLILAFLLVLIGVSLACRSSSEKHVFQLFRIVLLVTGVVLAHASVNLFNEYSDFRGGKTLKIKQDSFYRESGMLHLGYTRPSTVLAVAVIALMAATFIGIYFTLTAHWVLMLFILIGGFAIVTYKDLLAGKLWGEIFSGIIFGTMVVIGSYIALSASPMERVSELSSGDVWLVALPPGLLTSLLLLLNQIPNYNGRKTSKQTGRIALKKEARVFWSILTLTYLIIAFLPFTDIGSGWIWFALVPLPFLFFSAKTILFQPVNDRSFTTTMRVNILSVLLTDALLALSIFISW
ncbi:prenyltransferase [Prolixibacter denitrificans]|jgi:1,4-dihydroxy-2-naphthoate octaprenyltransferase|uniref:1,4-dihydroxy-2-naphthoate octaprenyltransferase n=1 Tax=Prolixibacter denitrificans TaxID=1541063 RepID=A0A2P8C6Q7_9BACT|nr:prenyltransferase [Prolixibacter denitrificans]PSK80653.1 1,4-dihydroxy-2-naphthoate octaprenyltransferase [Prolixibacter denitrificans]GET22052.1 1,4-dihydroxy-2-naphthoate octaprenyltransferase [Prolixibacter denitrificans]